jgi:hypothetical protein
MTIATYAELKSAVSDELLRAGDSTFQARLPRLIGQAELAIERELRVPELETTLNQTTTSGVATMAKPADLLETISLTCQSDPIRPLDAMELQALEQIYTPAQTGAPAVYALFGDNFRFGPTPDGVYTIATRYYKRLPKLSDAAPTNDVLARYWDLYFYGTLLASAPGLGDDARVQVWGQIYGGAMSAAMQVQNAIAVRSQYAAARAGRIYGRLS